LPQPLKVLREGVGWIEDEALKFKFPQLYMSSHEK
jgi:hypothetical protein